VAHTRGRARRRGRSTQRHIFLIPGFFGFANVGDFTYWGHVYRKLEELLDERGMPARIHSVKSLPTASLRRRTRVLLATIAAARPAPDAAIHLIGHSTGGLDARLLLTPGVDLDTRIDVDAYAARVRSAVSIASPHRGAPIATFFTGLLGRQLLRTLSLLTMATLRSGRLPLAVWAEMAGMFNLGTALGRFTGTLANQIYRQLLADFDATRRAQVEELLAEVERDQALLTQLTVESMDLFNAATGDRPGVRYGAVVTRARQPSAATALEIGIDPVDQAQHGLYYGLSGLAVGAGTGRPGRAQQRALRRAFGELPEESDSDGIVPTLSQPWGELIAGATADHLDIIGHFRDDSGGEQHYDWLYTRSNFSAAAFAAVWGQVADFLAAAEAAG